MSVPGTMGKVVFADLTNGTLQTETPPDELYRDYLGGYGLGGYYLYTRTKPGIEPLGPDNMLGFFAGLLTGTPAICGNRFQVVGKSPKTGGFGDANCGGNFGPFLKFAGFDGVVLEGAAAEPVYLLLDDGKAEIKSAADLWGLRVDETEAKLKALYGDKIAMVSIGPVGEAVSLLACIMNDRDRAAGRSGLGAVMGSKKVKAIVVRGQQAIPLADEPSMREQRTAHIKALRSGNGFYDFYHSMGTAGLTAGAVASGDCPVKNWAGTAEDFTTASKISDEAVIDIEYKKYGCWHCPITCGGFVKTTFGGEEIDGGKPEYETLGAFGAMLLVDDLGAIVKANDICNLYGMDTISTGCTIAFAYECYEKGILTTDDTGGLELTWGNAQAMVTLTEQIARCEGFGKVLAHGMKRAVEQIGKGSDEYAIHVGGEELPMHDPRLNPGLASSYKLDATPGRHTQFSAWAAEAGFPMLGLDDRYDGWTAEKKYEYTGKAKVHRIQSALMHVVNADGCCMFGSVMLPAQIHPDFISAATGTTVTMDDLLVIGDRIANLRVAYNLREGIRNADLKVPKRVLGDPPLQAGETKGITVDLAVQQAEYFAEMGWSDDGVPSKETLQAVGLDFVVPDIHG